MDNVHTDPELAYWIPRYIRARYTSSFVDLGDMSPAMLRIAESQDKIGWLHFMEGKVSSEIRRKQELYMLSAPTHMKLKTWMATFVSHILQISHSQWLYRNMTLHHRDHGTRELRRRQEILQEIERHLDLSPADIPRTSQFLLEIPFQELEHSHPTEQSYWLLAIQAARCAGRRAIRRGRRRTADSIAVAAARAAAIARGLKRRALSRRHSAPVTADTPSLRKCTLLPDAPPFVPTVNAFSKRRKPD